jgi:hypothetical protein
MTITEFLLARIAEDEAEAAEVLRGAQDASLALQEPRYLGTTQIGWHAWPAVERITARVLAECEAKRRIVAEHSSYMSGNYCTAHDGRYLVDQCPTLLTVASVYADHPDYRDEWRV